MGSFATLRSCCVRWTQIGRADLDNLAKPVLDTIFTIRNAQVRDPMFTGAAFSVDDNRVFSLGLEKREVPTEEQAGAEVFVSWD